MTSRLWKKVKSCISQTSRENGTFPSTAATTKHKSQTVRPISWITDLRTIAFGYLANHKYSCYSNAEEESPAGILEIINGMARYSSNRTSGSQYHSNGRKRSNMTQIYFRNTLLHKTFEMVLPQLLKVPLDLDDNENEQPRCNIKNFTSQLPPRAQEIIEKAGPLALVERMLPPSAISFEAQYVAMCFWAWLCVIDDMTEGLDPSTCLQECLDFLANPQAAGTLDNLSQFMTVVTIFWNTVNDTSVSSVASVQGTTWRDDFWVEIRRVIEALRAEEYLDLDFSMEQWLEIRLMTISVRPFMVLARASLGLPTNLDAQSPVLGLDNLYSLQVMMQAILGLQNDILGWEKDHTAGNPRNAIEVLIKSGHETAASFEDVLYSHNVLVRTAVTIVEALATEPLENSRPKNDVGAWNTYTRILLGFGNAMAKWMLTSKRYESGLGDDLKEN